MYIMIPQSYKGVRDFFPRDAAVLTYIIDSWKEHARTFGFQEYNASLLELTSLYHEKNNAELIDKQSYTFTDRGNRSVTLRPEMTPTVCRMIAHLQDKREFIPPVRWYSVPNVFRYESTQKGRAREHWQFNADIFGIKGAEADAEICSLIEYIYTSMGVPTSSFVIYINDRKATDTILLENGVDKKNLQAVRSIFDKKDTASKKDILHLLEEIGINKQETLYDALASSPEPRSITHLKTMTQCENIVYNPFLMRGFDYYTGIIFEVFDTSKKITRSLLGGGRYDTLIKQYGGSDTPAVGFGIGDVTTQLLLEAHELLPKSIPAADIYCVVENDTYIPKTLEMADALREEGLYVGVDYTYKKLSDQFKKAQHDAIPFALVVQDTNTYIRNIATRKDTPVSTINDIIKVLCEE